VGNDTRWWSNKRTRNRQVTSAGSAAIVFTAWSSVASCDAIESGPGAREGRDASARGACRPPSPIKGRDFTLLYLASARCPSLSPRKQPTISRLLMSVINGHLRVRRRRACAFQWRAMRETGARREARGRCGERVSCEWRRYSISGHYIHHATMREVLMTLHTRSQIVGGDSPRQFCDDVISLRQRTECAYVGVERRIQPQPCRLQMERIQNKRRT